MSREVADRIAAGMVAAWEHRVRHLDDHVVRSEGGIVTCLSNLPPAEQNVALVEREPRDALGSLSRAERLFEAHGRSFGIDVEAGRHPRMDRALRTFGLSLVVTRPAMAIRVEELEPPVLPAGVEVRRVTGPDELRAVAGIETAVFGTEPAVAERLFSSGWLAVPGVRIYLAIRDGEPAGFAWTSLSRRAVGVFGVGTLPEHRRLGIGRAVTAFAAREAPGADLAWLQSSEMGRPLYASMGFEPAGDWQVWVRPLGGAI